MRNYLTFVARSWPLLAFGFFSIFWGNFGQSFFISWYGSHIQAELGLSAGRYGLIYSLATLGSSLMIMAFGGAIDRWPLRRFTTVAALGLLLACLVMAASVNIFLLLFGFFLLRLFGQGFLPHTAQTTMARYFDGNRGKALSISASGVPAGEVVLPILVVALIAAVGWQVSWLVVGASVVLLYLPLVYWLLARSPVDISQPPLLAAQGSSTQPGGGRREMLADYRFWLALPAALAGPFMITGIFIQQGFILEQKGWDPLWLASCFVAFGISHWVTTMATGMLVDLFTARRLLPFMLSPLILSLFALVWLDGHWAALVFMTLLGMTIGASAPTLGALWAEVYGTARLGSIRSLMMSLVMISTAAAPVLFGVLIDTGISIRGLFGSAAWCVVLAAVLVSFSYRHSKI